MRTEHDDELDDVVEEGQAPLPGGPDGEGLTVSEAAEMLDLTPPEVRRLIRAGRLPARRFAGILGAEYRLDRADVERARGIHPGADDAAGPAAPAAPAQAAQQPDAPTGVGELETLRQEIAALRQGLAAVERHLSGSAGAIGPEDLRALIKREVAQQMQGQSPPPAVTRTNTQPSRPWWWVLRRGRGR